MFGQERVVEWCELGFGFVQQVADQMANGSMEGLLYWVKVCVTNKSEVELYMQSCKCWQLSDRRSKRSLTRHLLEARFRTLQVFFLLSRRYMMDIVTWSVEVGKREVPERLTAIPYENVTCYCFSKWVAGFEE